MIRPAIYAWIAAGLVFVLTVSAISWRIAGPFPDRCGLSAATEDFTASPELVACAGAGHVRAQSLLGMIYWFASTGSGGDRGLDPTLSEQELQDTGKRLLESAAAKKGGRDASNELGLACLKGEFGLERDDARALQYLAIAKDGGDEIAPLNLARIYAGGYGVERNLERAEEELALSAKRGYADAQCIMAEWKKTPRDSVNMLQSLLEAEYVPSCRDASFPEALEREIAKWRNDQWVHQVRWNLEKQARKALRNAAPATPAQCGVYRTLASAMQLQPDYPLIPVTLADPGAISSPGNETPDDKPAETSFIRVIDNDTPNPSDKFLVETGSAKQKIRNAASVRLDSCSNPPGPLWFTPGSKAAATEMQVGFSPVAFMDDGHRALVYVQQYCVGLCGSGSYFLFEAAPDGEWRLTGYTLAWIS